MPREDQLAVDCGCRVGSPQFAEGLWIQGSETESANREKEAAAKASREKGFRKHIRKKLWKIQSLNPALPL